MIPKGVIVVPKKLPYGIELMNNLFKECPSFNGEISNWNVSNVKDHDFFSLHGKNIKKKYTSI